MKYFNLFMYTTSSIDAKSIQIIQIIQIIDKSLNESSLEVLMLKKTIIYFISTNQTLNLFYRWDIIDNYCLYSKA